MGFFSKEEISSKARPDGRVYSCNSCGLFKTANSPRMRLYGQGVKKILFIGEAPGEREDAKGRPWQGKTGRLLQRTLDELGFDLFKDGVSINAVNCRPPDNRTPSGYEVDCCRKVMLSDAIREAQPNVVVPLGGVALHSFIGPRWQRDIGGISKWRGFTIPDYDYNCWTAPTFHPSYIERGDKEHKTIWVQDLQRILRLADIPLPPMLTPNIVHLGDDLERLQEFENVERIAYDYETTGIKPHAPGHRIVCAAVTAASTTFTFMMPRTKRRREPFTRLLTNPNIGKLAHNMKFEDNWTEYRLRVSVQGWEWDSMLMAHILDNRPGVTGLKFQTFVNFGVADYDSEVAPYLASAAGDKSGNAINQIDKLLAKPKGKVQLMHYCGLDSFYQYHLAMKQMNETEYSYLPF